MPSAISQDGLIPLSFPPTCTMALEAPALFPPLSRNTRLIPINPSVVFHLPRAGLWSRRILPGSLLFLFFRSGVLSVGVRACPP